MIKPIKIRYEKIIHKILIIVIQKKNKKNKKLIGTPLDLNQLYYHSQIYRFLQEFIITKIIKLLTIIMTTRKKK